MIPVEFLDFRCYSENSGKKCISNSDNSAGVTVIRIGQGVRIPVNTTGID